MSKSTPKLKDVLEVFLIELKSVEKNIISLVRKMEKYEKVSLNRKIQPNMEPLERWSKDFYTHLLEFKRHEKENFKKQKAELEQMKKNEKINLNRFFIYASIALIVTIGAMAFAFDRHHKANLLSEKVIEQENNLILLHEFLEEENLSQRLEKWYNKQN